MDTIVTARQAKDRFPELLELAARGERVVIRQRGKPSLTLTRLQEPHGTTGKRLQHAMRDLNRGFELPRKEQHRLEVLARKNEQGKLTKAEQTELDGLLHRLHELSRGKAQAFAKL